MRLSGSIAGASALLLLSGCSVNAVVQSGADAAACTALEGTLETISQAYRDGLVDSGVLESIDELVGDQVDLLLSTEFASEIGELGDALAQSDGAQGAQQRIDDALRAIRVRCEGVGVNLD